MGQSVLVIEDSRAVRDFVSSILESAGDYDVVEVDNGFDALRALPRAPYELIVCDVNIPDVNGIEIISFARRRPELRRVPIVVISADSLHPDTQRALAAGADVFLAKPFSAEAFLQAVATARRGRSEAGA